MDNYFIEIDNDIVRADTIDTVCYPVKKGVFMTVYTITIIKTNNTKIQISYLSMEEALEEFNKIVSQLPLHTSI